VSFYIVILNGVLAQDFCQQHYAPSDSKKVGKHWFRVQRLTDQCCLC